MIPMMLNFNRESVTGVQLDQSRALASEYSRQMFMITHAQLLMNAGLPHGWVQAMRRHYPRHQQLKIWEIVPVFLT